MSLTDYASDLGGNTIKINCYNLPDKVFLDANKTKNVIKFSILTNSDRKKMEPGSPDIRVTELTGRTRMITRKELFSNFVMIDGSKIKPYILKNGKEYIAYSRADVKYKIFKIPENMIGDVNGRMVPSGNYVVYEVDQNGSIDRKSMAIVSSKNFRKMFRVPNQKVLQAHKMDTPRRGFSVFKKYQKPEYRDKLMDSSSMMRPIQQPFQNNNISQDTNKINNRPVAQVSMQQQQVAQPNKFMPNQSVNKFVPNQAGGKFVPNQGGQFGTKPMSPNINTVGGNRATTAQEAQAINRQFMNQNPNTNKVNSARFAMVNRVVDLNGQLVGYTIIDKQTNKTDKLDENQVMRLAASGVLENVSLVTNNAGKRYLRGHGIIIDQLPKVIQ